MMEKKKGGQSIAFDRAPYLIESASVVGKKEGEGPLGKFFDMVEEDNLFGENTWEEAESTMQKEACTLALGKAHVKPEEVRFLFGGDLLRQGVATSAGVESLQIPLFGLFGACSTSGEALALASMCVAGRIWGVYAGGDIQPFRERGKGIPFSVGICQSKTSVGTVDGDGERCFPCRN